MCLSQEGSRKWNSKILKYLSAWITSLIPNCGVLAITPLYNWSAPERKPDLHISLAWLCVLHTHTHAHSLHNPFIISLSECGLSNWDTCRNVRQLLTFESLLAKYNEKSHSFLPLALHHMMLVQDPTMKCQVAQRHQLFKNNITHTLNSSMV